jgi:hypothetical protein
MSDDCCALLCFYMQLTNRAGMSGGSTASDSDCTRIFGSVAAFGTGSRCVWQTDDALVIFLGTSASIIPNDDLVVLATANLRGKNGVSDPTALEFPVSESLTPQAPVLSITGPNSIDTCSSLEVRAVASSPRPLVFRWRCLNDDKLDQTLQALSGPLFVSGEGTPELLTMDKTYQVSRALLIGVCVYVCVEVYVGSSLL